MCLWRCSYLVPLYGSPNSACSYASLVQAVDGVLSWALWLQVVSQAPQHFWSAEMQATCDSGFFGRQAVCSITEVTADGLGNSVRLYSSQREIKVVVQFRT